MRVSKINVIFRKKVFSIVTNELVIPAITDIMKIVSKSINRYNARWNEIVAYVNVYNIRSSSETYCLSCCVRQTSERF